MKTTLVAVLVIGIVVAPIEAYAQRGRGGGGGGGGFHGGGGGWQGGGGSGGGGWSGGGRGGSSGQSYRPSGSAGNSVQHVGMNNRAAPHQFNGHAYFGHRPMYHGGWYHGDWHGYWARPSVYRPWGWYAGGGWGWGWGFGVGLGVGAAVGVAAIGSPWGWGYYGYSNPYWVAPIGGVTYINYSQPIVMATPAAAPAPQPAASPYAPPYSLPGPSSATPSSAQEKGLATFESARSFFTRGDYPMALSQTNRAVAQLPNDSLLHEFRALCLFAMHDYQQSAAALYAVLSVGPGWDWATLSGLYPDANVYSEQLRALERFRDESPEAAPAHFVLAYHYMLAGHNDQAATELQTVVQLEPKDQLAAQLLKGLTTPEQQPLAAEPTDSLALPVEPASLIGTWRANRPDGSHFELKLTSDSKFRWDVAQQDKNQHLSGTYTLANNYLILTVSQQNALVGQVALDPGDQLHFKLAGGSPADPGLTFTR